MSRFVRKPSGYHPPPQREVEPEELREANECAAALADARKDLERAMKRADAE